MVTKYGYKIMSNDNVLIESWGYETEDQAKRDACNQDWAGKSITHVEMYRTTHRNYFGKQFKQVDCQKIN